MEGMIYPKDIDCVRNFYKRKYKKIFEALKDKKATNFAIDTSCGKYLELWCRISGYRLKINIGLNNKYNTCFESAYNTQIGAFRTMREAAAYIRDIEI